MILLWMLFFLGLIAIAVGGSLWRIPKKNYAVRSFFDERQPGVIYEGLHLWWPKPIGDMDFISLEPRTIEVSVTFQVTDEVEMTSMATIPYTPDPNYANPRTGINRFSLVADKEETDLKPYLKRFGEEKFGGMGGKISADEAVKRMESANAYINTVLRRSKAKTPHLRHVNCNVQGCDIKEEAVSIENIVKYYTLHWREVNEGLDKEKNDEGDRSPVEEEWGIDIGRVSFTQPRFSKKVQDARDAHKETTKRIDGVREEIKLAVTAKDQIGLSPADSVTFVREGTRPDVRISSMHFMGAPPPGLVNLTPLETVVSEPKQQPESNKQDGGKKRKGGRK